METALFNARYCPEGFSYFPHQIEIEEEFCDQMSSLAIKHGTSYDSYLTMEPDREYLWLQDGTGFICFVTKWKFVNVVGGLICANDRKSELVAGIKSFARLNKLTVSVFNVEDADISYFRESGFEVTHFAQDYLVDLTKNVHDGKAYRDLRQRLHSIKKKGITLEEVLPQNMVRREWRQLVKCLQELERENLAEKPQKKGTKVFQGHLTAYNLNERRLFVAFGEDRRPEAFIILNPYRDRREFGLETYRHRVGASPYVLRALIFDVMQILKLEGVQTLSLGIVPGLNCRRMEGDSKVTCFFNDFSVNHLRFILNTSGIMHFKNRFRPAAVRRLICVYPKASIGSSLALLSVWGVAKLDIKKTFLLWVKSLNKNLPPVQRFSQMALVLIGLSALSGHLSGNLDLVGLGKVTMASPLPLVFTGRDGIEDFESFHRVNMTFEDGSRSSKIVTKQDARKISGIVNLV